MSHRPGPARLLSAALILSLLSAAQAASAADIGLRVRFGLNDEKPTKWDGTVEVAPGRVVHIGGWRFGKGDEVDGVQGWKAQTRPGSRGWAHWAVSSSSGVRLPRP